MSGVKGDFKGLAELRARLVGLKSEAFKVELSQLLAATAIKQTADGFRAERDPYGKPWKKITHRNGRILQDTGRMRASFAVAPRPNGFRIDGTAVYTPHHQHGTRRIARRQMLPDDSTGGLGPIWGKAFNETAIRLIRRRMKGSA